MAWGVLEDHKMAKVPGTVALDDGNAASEGTRAAIATLKRQGEVVLAPQPSNSPNDPLVCLDRVTAARIAGDTV